MKDYIKRGDLVQIGGEWVIILREKAVPHGY